MLVDTLAVRTYNPGMRLGPVLREHRRQRGLTTAEVADLLGVQQSAVSKWENGRSLPDDDKMDAIAAFLGLTRSEAVLLRDGADPDPRPSELEALEARLDRFEVGMMEMLELLHDLDRRIQGRSPGDDEGG